MMRVSVPVGPGASWRRVETRKMTRRAGQTRPPGVGRSRRQRRGSDAPALTDADMPPIESLDEDSDYAQFLSPQVSTGLRRRALRKLFGLPRFQGSDGLNDYDEDFRRFTALGDMITYEMRRGPETERQPANQVADREEDETPPVAARPGR